MTSVLWWAPPWLNHIDSCILDKLYERCQGHWSTEKVVKANVELNLRKPVFHAQYALKLAYLLSTAFSK